MIATGLDHAGVAVRDLAAAGDAWAALGFQVTAAAPHLPGGITGNRCVMFRHGYVELLGMLGGHSATLERFLGRYEGVHVLSLATTDAAAAGQRLNREVVRSERETAGGVARFARVVLSEMEPRVQLIEQITPELVWQPDLLLHPNGASELLAVVMTSAEPAVAAAALSLAAGVPVVPDPAGGYALRMKTGEVRVVSDIATVFPGLTAPRLPFVGGIVVRAPDLAGQIAHASGVAIRFVA